MGRAPARGRFPGLINLAPVAFYERFNPQIRSISTMGFLPLLPSCESHNFPRGKDFLPGFSDRIGRYMSTRKKKKSQGRIKAKGQAPNAQKKGVDQVAKVYDYYATTVSGLEQVVAADLKHSLGEIQSLQIERGRRHGRLFFRYERSPKKLLELRSVDNLFALLTRVRNVTVGHPGLQQIADAIGRIDLQPAMSLHDKLHGDKEKATCRLICTVGGDHRFSTGDLYRAVSDTLAANGTGIEAEQSAYILHLQVKGGKALLGFQLAQSRLRNRDYRRETVPGGLEATAAYCMALLAEIKPGDVCLDPMCGGATLLIEAALGFGPGRLIGGDISPEALAAARQNDAAARTKIDLMQWDAGRLPLNSTSVDVLLCNLPFDKKVSYAEGDSGTFILEELTRVIRPGGRAVLLTSDREAMESFLEYGRSSFTCKRRLPLRLRGVEPFLYLLEKTLTPKMDAR
jgi:tRNA (guanine6-N2)-methyltransferase